MSETRGSGPSAPHPAPATGLGHAALFVSDLEASRRFYRDVVGLRAAGEAKGGRLVFLSGSARHHDLALELARAPGLGPQPKGRPGLYHLAFVVGAELAALAAARAWAEGFGLAAFGETATSFSLHDPDGNEVELFVERAQAPDAAREAAGGRTNQMATSPAASAPTAKANPGR